MPAAKRVQPETDTETELVIIDDNDPATTVGLENAVRNSQTAPNKQGDDGWGSDYPGTSER